MAGLMGGIGTGLSSFMDSFNTTKNRIGQEATQKAATERLKMQDLLAQNKAEAEAQKLQYEQQQQGITSMVGSRLMRGETLDSIINSIPEEQQKFINIGDISSASKNLEPKIQLVEVDGMQVAYNPVSGEKIVLGKAKGFAPQQPQWAVAVGPNGETDWVQKGQPVKEGYTIRDSGGVTVNMEPGGGKLQNVEIKDLRNQIRASDGVSNTLDNFAKIVGDNGWTPQFNPLSDQKVVAQLGAAHRAVQLELKELLNLGVLNGPDLDLMNQMLIDPTEVPANPLQWNNRKDQIVASIGEVKNYLAMKKKAAERELKIQQPDAPELQQTTEKTKFPQLELQMGDGSQAQNNDPLGIR